MAFDISTAKPVAQKSGGFDISTAKPTAEAAPATRQQAIDQFTVGGRDQGMSFMGAIGQGVARAQQGPAGKATAADIEAEAAALRDPFTGEKRETHATRTLPELAGNLKTLLGGLDLPVSAAVLTTYRPEEQAKILMSASPDVGVVQDENGNLIAVNNKTGFAAVINKPGFSSTDKYQLAASAGAFAPAGMARSVLGGGLAAGLTQTAAEGLQASQGGTFDTGDIAIAAAGGAAANLPGAANRAFANQPARSLINVETGYPTREFEKALKSKNIIFENVVDDVARLPPDIEPERAVNEIIKRKIRAGDTDGFLATKMLNKSGNVIDDDIAKEGLKQGFREGDIQNIKVANPGTKRGFLEMLDIKRRIFGNEYLGSKIRPTDVIGRSGMRRYDHIMGAAGSARLELDKIAKNNLAGTAIDVESVTRKLSEALDNLDIEVTQSGAKPIPKFEGSLISKDKTSQNVIKDVIDLLAEPKAPDALRAHKLKRQLDTMIDFRSKESQGLTESGEKVAREIRTALNDAIRAVNDDYARVNDVLYKALGARDDLQRAIGPSIDLRAEGADKALGQELRNILSNNKSRVRIENALNTLDTTARELDGVFDDDIGAMIVFNRTLEDKFGATARGSLEGVQTSAFDRAMQGREGIKQMAIDKAAKTVEEMRNINDRQAFRVLDQLIKRKD